MKSFSLDGLLKGEVNGKLKLDLLWSLGGNQRQSIASWHSEELNGAKVRSQRYPVASCFVLKLFIDRLVTQKTALNPIIY